jgi:hypothetical protein
MKFFVSAHFNLEQAPVLVGHQDRVGGYHSNLRFCIFCWFTSRGLTLGWSDRLLFYRGRVGVFIGEALENNMQLKFNLSPFFAYFIYDFILRFFFIFRFWLCSFRVGFLSLRVSFDLFFNLDLGQL